MKPIVNKQKLYKTIALVLILLMLATTTIVYAKDQINQINVKDNTSINAESQDKLDKIYAKNLTVQETKTGYPTNYPPDDSTSARLSTNTNNIFMKVDYIPQTDWVDITGYYSQSNYFQLPISVKLVDSINNPLKYQNIYEYIYEYKDNGFGYYQYIRSYSKSGSTGTTGIFESLFSLPYRGYYKSMYITIISFSDANGNYATYRKNIHAAWYIN